MALSRSVLEMNGDLSKITNFPIPCVFKRRDERVPLEFCNGDRSKENLVMPHQMVEGVSRCVHSLRYNTRVTDGLAIITYRALHAFSMSNVRINH